MLDSHVWRYQLPNPLNDVDATKGISLFPHVVAVEVMLACENYITNHGVVLFVTRMKRASETAKCIEQLSVSAKNVEDLAAGARASDRDHRWRAGALS